MTGYVERTEGKRRAYCVSVWKPEGKRPFGKRRRNNIHIGLKWIRWDFVTVFLKIHPLCYVILKLTYNKLYYSCQYMLYNCPKSCQKKRTRVKVKILITFRQNRNTYNKETTQEKCKKSLYFNCYLKINRTCEIGESSQIKNKYEFYFEI